MTADELKSAVEYKKLEFQSLFANLPDFDHLRSAPHLQLGPAWFLQRHLWRRVSALLVLACLSVLA